MSRPQRSEYHPYYSTYIDQVPDGDILKILESQLDGTLRLLDSIGEEQAEYRYARDKWSIKEVMGHVVDEERTFAYRALMFSRGNPGPLVSVEQDDMVAHANFSERDMADIAHELRHSRLSNIILFRSFDEEILSRKGIAAGNEFTVRSLVYLIAGHETHHLRIIRERYLKGT